MRIQYAPSRQMPTNELGKVLSETIRGLGTDRRFADQMRNQNNQFMETLHQRQKENALTAARADKRDALAAARDARLEQHYQDGLTHRNQLEAEAKAKEIEMINATIAEASADPLDVDFTETKTGVFDVTDANGNVVQQDEYDTQKIQDLLKTDPKAFDAKPVDELQTVNINPENQWASELLKKIDLDPTLSTPELKKEALNDALTKRGYSGLVGQDDIGLNKFSKEVKGGLASAKNSLLSGIYDVADWFPGKKLDRSKLNQVKLDDQTKYRVNDVRKLVEDKAKKYAATVKTKARIKAYNKTLKEEEDNRIANLYESLKTKNKVGKSVVDTRTTDRGTKAIANEIRRKASKKIKAYEKRKDLSPRMKAAYIRGELARRNEKLKEYADIKTTSDNFKIWNEKENVKTGNKIRTNRLSEIDKVKGKLKVLGKKLSSLRSNGQNDKEAAIAYEIQQEKLRKLKSENNSY